MNRVGTHPHWWKEIRAIMKFTMESALMKYTVKEDLNKPEVLYFSCLQAVTFRLPLAQQETSGRCDVPACF